jgi:hypothetical protein
MKIKGTYKHIKDFYKQKKMRKEGREKDQRKAQIFIKVVFAHRGFISINACAIICHSDSSNIDRFTVTRNNIF